MVLIIASPRGLGRNDEFVAPWQSRPPRLQGRYHPL